MRRPVKVKVSRLRGVDRPEDLARQLTEYLLGRTNTPPTIRIDPAKEAS